MGSDFKNLSRKEAEEKIKEMLSGNPSPEKLKKLKRLAMSRNIKIGVLKKRFCKNCYSFFNSENSEIRIKNRFKIIRCKNCKYITRFKLKSKKEK